MLNYNHLYYFHVVASEGTIASAAGRLNVSQATVSEQVRTLERTLQLSLFDRQPGGLKLTGAGKLAFEHTSVMFRAGERLSEALGHERREIPRTLRIGLTGAVGRATSTDFLMPLLAIDECTPSIRGGESAELLRDLRTNELDLVLCESEPPEAARQGLKVALLDKMVLVAIAAPGVVPAPDWHNLTLIHYRATSTFRWEVESYLETKSLRPRIAGETDDTLFMLEATARGGYISFVPRSVARDAVVAGRACVIARLEPTHAGVHALYQDGTAADLASRAVEALVEHVRTQQAD